MFQLVITLYLWLQYYGIFYGSRHGKSSSEGETIALKYFLFQETKRADVIIDDPKGVFNHLCNSDRLIVSGSSRRHFYFVSKMQVDERRLSLPYISTLPGSRKLHQIKVD